MSSNVLLPRLRKAIRSLQASACLLLALITLSALVSACRRQATPTDAELGFHYAPVHYQDTDAQNAQADFITRLDFDGNLVATDNWENLTQGGLSAWAYYSVVETCTHWYILYAFYHPRDWSGPPAGLEHENDMEGLLEIVRKDRSRFGDLQAIVTIFHNDFYTFTPKGSRLAGTGESIDGQLSFEKVDGVMRPMTSQEARGHGLKAWPYAGKFRGAKNQDGVIYYPSEKEAGTPRSGDDRQVPYRLVDLFSPGSLWPLALSEDSQQLGEPVAMAKWGTLRGDKMGGCGKGAALCQMNAAHLPWGWDDIDDGDIFRGEIALDPAHLAEEYFQNLGSFSRQYLHNPYLEDLRVLGYRSNALPAGWPEQLDLEALYGRLGADCD
jgi:hypothetical protein